MYDSCSLEVPGGSAANYAETPEEDFRSQAHAASVTVARRPGALEAKREKDHAHCADDFDVRGRSCLPDPILSRHHYDQRDLPYCWRRICRAMRATALLPDLGRLRAHYPYWAGLVNVFVG